MDKLTNEDIKNIIGLINRTTLSGNESIGVAILLQKLIKLSNAETIPNSKSE